MAATSPFTPAQQRIFDEKVAVIFPHYPPERRSASLIPVLHIAQDQLGWMPEAAMDYVAEVVGVSLSRVREVVTFYTMFQKQPIGKTHVQVCVNLSCWLLGSDKLVDTCKKRIGEQQFKPTADGKFSWCEVECLAACGGAPAVQINDDYHEPLTVEKLEKLLDSKG